MPETVLSYGASWKAGIVIEIISIDPGARVGACDEPRGDLHAQGCLCRCRDLKITSAACICQLSSGLSYGIAHAIFACCALRSSAWPIIGRTRTVACAPLVSQAGFAVDRLNLPFALCCQGVSMRPHHSRCLALLLSFFSLDCSMVRHCMRILLVLRLKADCPSRAVTSLLVHQIQ